jgi:hypothetical protein
MTGEQLEAAAFAAWRVFARQVRRRWAETDEGAWRRRWRDLPERVREDFRTEARAAIEVMLNGEWMEIAA